MENLGRNLAFGFSGAVGALLGVLADIIQKEEASAVMKITDVGTRLLELSAPPAAFAGFLILVGVALAFIFGADTNKKSFYIGASIVTIMMTLVPFKLPAEGSANLEKRTVQVAQSSGWPVLVGLEGEILPPNCREGIGRLDIFLHSVDGKPLKTVFVKVAQYYSEDDQRIFRKFWVNAPSTQISLNTTLGSFVVTIEAWERGIIQREVKIDCNAPTTVDVTLRSTWGPRFLEKLITPRKVPRK